MPARWWWIALWSLFWTTAQAGPSGSAESISVPEHVQGAKKALVQVIGVFNGQRRVAGTGFWVSEEGHALTSAKPIEGAAEVFLFAPALGQRMVPAKEVDHNRQANVSLLKVESPTKLSPVRLYESVSPLRNDRVYVIGLSGSIMHWQPECWPTSVRAVTSFPDRGRMIELDSPLPASFIGGPILSASGIVMGIVTSKPQEAQERPQVGWGTPIEPAAAMLAVNRVPYEAYRGLRSYLSWRSLVSLLALALFIYGAYLIHLWHWQGKRAVIARLPARQIALCLLASFLIHLGTIVAILVAQQRLVLEVEQGNLAEVGLLDVGEEGGSGIPIAAPQPMAAPTVAPRPVAQRAPVQQVDISGLEEKAEQAIKEIGEKVTQADAQSAAAEGAAHEGVVAGARAGVGQRGQARRGLQANLQDLLDKLAEASKAKSGGPGGSAGDDEIFARRARWTLNIPHGINFYEFIDRYGAELATWSAKTPETLRYLSNLTGGLSMRTGLVSQEPRYHWAPIGVDIHRDGEVALFRKAGWHVGWDDPIVIFFPESFEQLLIKLEKDFRERAGMRKKPRSTIFEVQPDLGIIVLESK